MATLTSTLYSAQAKAVHVGVNNVQVTYTIAASASIGDIVFLAKIPNGAVITDWYEQHTNGSAGTTLLDLGLATGAASGQGDFAFFGASLSESVVNRFGALGQLGQVGFPGTVSLSASDPNGFGILAARVIGGTMTTSLVISVSMNYRVDA